MFIWKIAILVFIPFCFGNPMKTCIHPTAPYSCRSILDYMRCLGRPVQDCKQTDQYIYWRDDDPSMTWNNAQAACEGVDKGNLVSIHDFEEQNIMMMLFEAKAVRQDVWVGLHCLGNCNSFYDYAYSDGTPVDYLKINSAICGTGSSSGPAAAVVTKYRDAGDWEGNAFIVWCAHAASDQHISICKVAIQ